MAKGLISKELLEKLEENAPKNYDVMEHLADITLYDEGEQEELFDKLYFEGDKDLDYYKRMSNAFASVSTEDLENTGDAEDNNPFTVREYFIEKHGRGAVILLEGERQYVHYSDETVDEDENDVEDITEETDDDVEMEETQEELLNV